MDVPFASSGAMTRAHYAFVRKVEECITPNAADQMLQEEASSLQYQLSQPGLSQRRCKEALIMLLYCATATSFGTLPSDVIESALPHAITLAESGVSVQNKRIGYLFCSQLMPAAHELRLMLINTLRKDLESMEIPLICLAADALIESPNELVVPAVQTRLHDLLSHSSPHVQRRSLLALKALSSYAPTLFNQISSKVYKRISDHQLPVVRDAILTMMAFLQVDNSIKERATDALNALLQTQSDYRDPLTRHLLLALLPAVRAVGIADQSLNIITKMIKATSASHSQALLYECFRVLRDCGAVDWPAFRSAKFSPVRYIRELLVSQEVNDQYTFLLCLDCLDPILWAGTSPEVPPVLEGWEVERVMQFLSSQDSVMRRKTIAILNKVDPGIVAGYYSQILQSLSDSTSHQQRGNTETLGKLLEIIELQAVSDGEAYAREIKELFRVLEGPPLNPGLPVMEQAVQMVLLHVMAESEDFANSCATVLLTAISEIDMHIGPTLIVLSSALAVERAGKVPVPPLDILVGLGSRLEHCSPAVQDTCLIAMLRLSVLCDEMPSNVISYVSEAMHRGGRHIKRRCDQFLVLSAQKNTISKIVQSSRGSSLPDFLAALQDHEAKSSHSSARTRTSTSTSPKASPALSESCKLSSPKLRYKAYEPPPSTPPSRRHLSTPRSSPMMIGREIQKSPSRRPGLLEPLSNTISPGELALVASSDDLDMNIRKAARSPVQEDILEDISSRIDLIAFDTPTVTENRPSSMDQEIDFEASWDALSDTSGARGWCAMSMEAVLRILQQSLEGYRLKVIAVDFPPFPGELKISITDSNATSDAGHALVRLKDSDEDSCLWRMRCADVGLRTRLKRLFASGEP